MTEQGTGTQKVVRACNLWKGFLLSKDASPELALVFCKGALMALNPNACSHTVGVMA